MLPSFECYKARDFCKTDEATGDLVSITSEPIQKFIESLITDSVTVWIGASKKAGSLVWNDGSLWSYAPAGSDGVSSVSDGDCGALSVTVGTTGMFIFSEPDNIYANGFICQY